MYQYKVSVVMSIYNGGESIHNMMDCLLNQTLDNIEIILVNHGSSDNTGEVIEYYAENYKDIVKAYTTEYNAFPGHGRNFGFSKSTGKYVYFCDCDDMMDYGALQALYNEAEKYDSDMVIGWNWVLQNNVLKKQKAKRTCSATVEMAIMDGPEFWVRLFRRELVEACGKMPENIVIDDLSWVTVVSSYAKNLRFLNHGIYVYDRRQDSTMGSASEKVCKNMILAENYILDNVNPKYREIAEYFVAFRLAINLRNRWQYSDLFIQHIADHWESFKSNSKIIKDKKLYDYISGCIANLSKPQLPNKIYLNGFNEALNDEYLQEISRKAFNEGAEVEIINKESVDDKAPEIIKCALVEKKYKFVFNYVALKKIYENGGIMLDENIKIRFGFNYLKQFDAFFSFVGITEYSDWILGGIPGNDVFKDLIDTYEKKDFGGEKYFSLAKRIKTILTVKYKVPLNGKSKKILDNTFILNPYYLVLNKDIEGKNVQYVNMCVHDFKASSNNDDFVLIHKSLLNNMSEKIIDTQSAKELKKIRASDSYKLARRLSNFGNTKFGTPFKKIFKWFLKKYRKHKYGMV